MDRILSYYERYEKVKSKPFRFYKKREVFDCINIQHEIISELLTNKVYRLKSINRDKINDRLY